MQMWNLNTYILETFVFVQRQPHHKHRGDMKMTSDCFVFSPNIGKTNVYTLKCHTSSLNEKIEIYQNAKNDVNLRMSSCCADF